MSKPQSVCILRLSALGDCINAFGMAGAIKHQYPDVDVTMVIDKRFAPLFTDEQNKDLIPMLQVNFKERGLKAALDLKQDLKKQAEAGQASFDVLLNMQTSIKASLCSLMIKAPDKYGYDKERSREMHSWFINHEVKSPSNPHVLAGFIAFAKECGLPIDKPIWDFKLDPFLIDKVSCMVNHERIFAICPCSAKAQKNWTVDGYAQMARYAQEKGLQVVLLGGGNDFEKQVCADIAQKCDNVINMCGRTNLRELAAMLKISKLVLSPDSGSMHLAQAVGTPVIGLFAVHNDERVGPWNFSELNVSVYKDLALKELKGDTIPWRYRVRDEHAMQHISVDMVKASFDKALQMHHI